MVLYNSPVVFDEVNHIYSLNGVTLNGVTRFIDHYINGDKFANLDGRALANVERKREYGSAVHNQIQMRIDGMPYADELPEVAACMRLLEENGIKPLAPEYLVSDEKFFASKIDLVSDSLDLIDYKTSTKLDMEALRWQLSLYAYMFEKQNAGAKVNNLYAIHLDGGKAELVHVGRLPNKFVEAFAKCCKNGDETFNNPRMIADSLEKRKVAAYKKAAAKLEALKEKEGEVIAVMDGVKDYFEQRAINDLETDFVRGTYAVHYTPVTFVNRQSFDIESFIKDNGNNKELMDVFGKYIKTTSSTRKSQVTIKFV